MPAKKKKKRIPSDDDRKREPQVINIQSDRFEFIVPYLSGITVKRAPTSGSLDQISVFARNYAPSETGFNRDLPLNTTPRRVSDLADIFAPRSVSSAGRVGADVISLPHLLLGARDAAQSVSDVFLAGSRTESRMSGT